MSGRAVFAFWFLLMFLAGSAMQYSQAQSMGGLGGLIGAGEDHSVRPYIEEALPDVPLAPNEGHDGQLFYSIGLDPLAREAPAFLAPDESVSYRYRRIGYPAAASLFGVLEGEPLVVALALLTSVSASVAAGAVALIARHFDRTPWVAVAVVLNPGVWLSLRLLTADNLALAAGLLAILALVKGRLVSTVALLAVAVLTKEVAALFAIGVAGFLWFRGRQRSGAFVLVGALAPLMAWLTYLQSQIGSALDGSGNVSLPLVGIIEAAPVWSDQRLRDNLWVALMVITLIIAAWSLVRVSALWRWLIAPWLVMALMSSKLVWGAGNNAIRTLAPLIVLTLLGLAVGRQETDISADRLNQPAHP